MTSRRKLYTIAIASVAGLAFAACGSSKSASTTSVATTETTSAAVETTAAPVVTETTPDLSGVTLTVAVATSRGNGRQAIRLASGAFDGAPYTIKWAEFPNGDAALEALNGGAADVMADLQSSNIVLAAGNAKDAWTDTTRTLAIVGAERLTTKQGVQLVVKADSGINSIADLKGKKVSFSKGSNTEYFWSVLAKQAGLAPGDVEEVKLKSAESRAAFLAGEVDGLLAFDYNLIAMKRTENLKVLAASGDAGISFYSLIVVRQGLLDDAAHAAAVADLIKRIHASEAWPAAHVAEARKIWEQVDEVNPLDSEELVVSSVTEPAALDAELQAALQQQVDLFAERGIIERKFDAAVLFDRRFED